ncbi:hypothetical protein [Dyella sp.]|uniref:hypothetical protein n=1 Tax=Dyella sp. TaxID=1869338 RepID=UPI002B48E1A4|nr:hypothetical protein [Dyella sp.]HKT29204.1 hypothetical protein [Dyella sp.]
MPIANDTSCNSSLNSTASTEGITSQKMQQSGIGLLLTVLVIWVPPLGGGESFLQAMQKHQAEALQREQQRQQPRQQELTQPAQYRSRLAK